MLERNEGTNLKLYRKYKLTPEKATLMSTALGLFYGGVSYGIARLAADGELAKKVGIGVGGGLATASAGIFLGIEAQVRSEELAIKGEHRKAMFKMAQSSAMAAIGLGVSGAVSTYEATGLKGAVVGGAVGTLVGAIGLARSAKELHDLAQAHRDLIIPTQNPRNFPQYHVIKSELFNDEDLLNQYPPVYMAATFSDMEGFRQAQVYRVMEKSTQLSGVFKAPETSLERMSSALFIIPGISHYPAFDPEDSNLSIQLSNAEDINESIVAHSHRHSRTVWPYSTVFNPYATFSEEHWKYWKERSWKYGVVLLAERNIKGRDRATNALNIEEKYYLVDILVSGPDRGKREEKKEPEKVGEPIPALNPRGI